MGTAEGGGEGKEGAGEAAAVGTGEGAAVGAVAAVEAVAEILISQWGRALWGQVGGKAGWLVATLERLPVASCRLHAALKTINSQRGGRLQ